MDEFAHRERPPLARRARIALARVLPTLRTRFFILLFALVGAGLLPFIIATDAYGKAHGFTHRLERAGSLRHRLLAQARVSGDRDASLRLLGEQRALLAVLISGDPRNDLPPCGSTEICARLSDHLSRWDAELYPRLEASIATGQRDGALERAVDEEVARLDRTVTLDARHSERRIDRIRVVGLWGSLGSLVLVGLVGYGVWEVFSRIRRLGEAARVGDAARISEEGVLDDELGALARSLADGLRKDRAQRAAERRRLAELTQQQEAVRSSTESLNAWLAEQAPIEPALEKIAAATGHLGAELVSPESERGAKSAEQHLTLAWRERVLGTLVFSGETGRPRSADRRALESQLAELLTIASLARSLLDQREQRRKLAARLVGISRMDELNQQSSSLLRELIRHDRCTITLYESQAERDEALARVPAADHEAGRLAVELSSGEATIGVLELERDGGGFSPADDEAARAVAPIFAAAVLRMQLQAKLREAERWSALGAFGRHLAHELKNPLNGLLLRLSLLERQCRKDGDPAGLLAHTTVIREEAARLSALIDDGLATLPSRGAPAAEVDLRASIGETLGELEEALSGSGVSLERELGESPVLVRGDTGRLRRVVRQMLEDSLARASADDAARIRLRLEREGELWCFHLERSGAPFPDLAELFVPGAEQSLGGTGMELALCRRIARALGGDLVARNLEPSGARLTLTLPAART